MSDIRNEHNLLEKRINEYLVNNVGFDKSQIQQEWKSPWNNRHTIDIAILDTDESQKPLALIEVKMRFSPKSSLANAIARQCILSSEGIETKVHYFVATTQQEVEDSSSIIFYLLEYNDSSKIIWYPISTEELFDMIKSPPNDSKINFFWEGKANELKIKNQELETKLKEQEIEFSKQAVELKKSTHEENKQGIKNFEWWIKAYAIFFFLVLMMDIVIYRKAIIVGYYRPHDDYVPPVFFSYERLIAFSIIPVLFIFPYIKRLKLFGLELETQERQEKTVIRSEENK